MDVENGILRIERRDDGIAILWIDVPEKDVNILKEGYQEDFQEALGELESDADTRAVVIASSKPDNFLAGADVKALRMVDDAEEARRLSRAAQEVMQRVESFSRPVVAAIHGACVGGGLELALACRERVASDHETTELGLPEVQLGLIPGGGGTQRLPRVIGLEKALKLILTGKQVPAGKAHAMGMVDEIVHPAILLDVATERARQLAEASRVGSDEAGVATKLRQAVGKLGDVRQLKALLLEDNPAGRRLVFNQSRKQVLSRTQGNMPAPLRALEVIQTGVFEGREEGMRAEAEAFGELAVSPEAESLMELFLAREQLKKEQGANAKPRAVNKVGVLGAGLMGSGISFVTAAKAGLPVRIKDVDHETLRTGLRSTQKSLAQRAEKKKMPAAEVDEVRNQIRPTTDYTGFKRADVVIEAVAENLELKHKVLQEVEEVAGPEMIFASNTSSIPIREIAEASEHPERVIGMHYFSPAEKVPLLEVVASEHTADWVTATCVALGKKQGKTVIVVNDGTGFYTTRILGPYLIEAGHLLNEGVSIEHIDQALVDFGFPVGPIQLLDDVGIDVAHEIEGVMQDAFGERMRPAGMIERMVENDRLGKKNGKGFYKYEEREDGFFEREDGSVDESAYELLETEKETDVNAEEIGRRCTLAMVNEAVRCYEDGILRSARDGDVGAVFGLGFPPFLGGPFRFVDQRGPKEVLKTLERYTSRVGERFKPAPLIRTLAERDLTFHAGTAPPPGSSKTPAGT